MPATQSTANNDTNDVQPEKRLGEDVSLSFSRPLSLFPSLPPPSLPPSFLPSFFLCNNSVKAGYQGEYYRRRNSPPTNILKMEIRIQDY